jgi:hypothetical protein
MYAGFLNIMDLQVLLKVGTINFTRLTLLYEVLECVTAVCRSKSTGTE